MLAVTVWKQGAFGFPFGLLLPLTVLGVAVAWRRLTVPVALYLVLYPLSVVMVFVSGRYRVPVVPVMAVVAAAGLVWLMRSAAASGGRRLVLAAALMAATVAAAVVPGPFCQEDDLEGEYWFLVAAAELRNNQPDRAVAGFRRAVAVDPVYFEARYQLGVMLLDRGEIAEAAEHLERAVAVRPDFAPGHRELGSALGRLGRFQAARVHLERALAEMPDDVSTLNALGALSAREGDLAAARRLLERAVTVDPENRAARENLDYVLRALAAGGGPSGTER
jgi:tetratricopeptide (TPR) repeat protein